MSLLRKFHHPEQYINAVFNWPKLSNFSWFFLHPVPCYYASCKFNVNKNIIISQSFNDKYKEMIQFYLFCMIDIAYIKIFHEIWNIFLIWISLNVPSYYAIFRKLLYFWNYLEFSKTVWDAKSKNITYDFARILGMKAAQIYTHMVAE